MKTLKTILLVTLLFLFCFSCSTQISNTKTNLNKNSNVTYNGSKVIIRNQCLISEEIEEKKVAPEAIPPAAVAIIAALAPKIVDKGIDLGAEYLKKKSDEYSGSSTARESAELYIEDIYNPSKLIPTCGCISVVRGKFGEEVSGENQNDSFWNKSNLEKLKITEAPYFYAEFKVAYTSNCSHFRLIPKYIEFNKAVSKRIGKSNSKDILINIVFETPATLDEKEKTKRFAEFQLAFNELPLGSRLNAETLSSISTNWMALPAPFKAKNDDKSNINLIPFSIIATVQETENSGDLLLKSSEVLSESKEKLAKEVLDIINNALNQKKEENPK